MSEDVRFIRVRGRVIPIKAKDAKPSKKQMEKNYNKYGDGANQASRIDEKYNDKANKKSLKFGIVGALGIIGAVHLKSTRMRIASGIIGVTGAALGQRAASKEDAKNAVAREKDYVKAFGMDSYGNRPFKKRKKGSYRK